jgi:ABC-type metal ion transport system substrate-binding protein
MLNPLADRGTVTEADIVRNPRELAFNRMDASLAVGALATNDLAVITGGFAYAGGLDIGGALYNEILTPGMKIVIAVRTEDLGRQFVRSILDVVHSDAFKDAITDESSIFSGFQRPTYLLLHTGGAN